MTTEPGDAAQDAARGVPARLPRWLYPALIASMAINLLFVGGVGAAFWHHRQGPGGHGRGGDFGLMGFVRELPRERQTFVRDQLTAARQMLRPLRKAVRDAWDQSNTALAAEPFDKEALKAALAQQTDAESKFKSAMTSALAETAEQLKPEERRLLQTWREKQKKRMFGRHGRRGEGPPGGPEDQE